MGMKLKMNERRVRSEELPLRNSESRCGLAPSGNNWAEPSRKVEKWIPPNRREAAPKHSCWVTTRRKPFFLQVQHPVSTNKDSVFFVSSGFVIVWNPTNKDCLSTCGHTNKSRIDYPDSVSYTLLKIEKQKSLRGSPRWFPEEFSFFRVWVQ